MPIPGVNPEVTQAAQEHAPAQEGGVAVMNAPPVPQSAEVEPEAANRAAEVGLEANQAAPGGEVYVPRRREFDPERAAALKVKAEAAKPAQVDKVSEGTGELVCWKECGGRRGCCGNSFDIQDSSSAETEISAAKEKPVQVSLREKQEKARAWREEATAQKTNTASGSTASREAEAATQNVAKQAAAQNAQAPEKSQVVRTIETPVQAAAANSRESDTSQQRVRDTTEQVVASEIRAGETAKQAARQAETAPRQAPEQPSAAPEVSQANHVARGWTKVEPGLRVEVIAAEADQMRRNLAPNPGANKPAAESATLDGVKEVAVRNAIEQSVAQAAETSSKLPISSTEQSAASLPAPSPPQAEAWLNSVPPPAEFTTPAIPAMDATSFAIAPESVEDNDEELIAAIPDGAALELATFESDKDEAGESEREAIEPVQPELTSEVPPLELVDTAIVETDEREELGNGPSPINLSLVEAPPVPVENIADIPLIRPEAIRPTIDGEESVTQPVVDEQLFGEPFAPIDMKPDIEVLETVTSEPAPAVGTAFETDQGEVVTDRPATIRDEAGEITIDLSVDEQAVIDALMEDAEATIIPHGKRPKTIDQSKARQLALLQAMEEGTSDKDARAIDLDTIEILKQRTAGYSAPQSSVPPIAIRLIISLGNFTIDKAFSVFKRKEQAA